MIRTPNGGEIHRAPNGVVRDVRARGFDIHHGPGGVRVVRVERPDHVVIVTGRPGFGYVQRPYVFRDQALIHRTYFVNGVAYARVYRPYTYRGVVLTVYAPSRYYSPVFYTWAYTPWGVPVAYSWDWAGRPWYGYYGGYFAPYPVYAGPSFWLTDYLLATTLELSYQERMNAAANAQANYSATPLTPDVKQAISAEVQQQLAMERAQGQIGVQGLPDPASSSIAQVLSDGRPHVFVVASGLDVPSTDRGECAITEGDVLQLNAPPPPNAVSAALVVLASKGGPDCRRGSTVYVALADLQDMQNHMRATIDQGLAELQARQGQRGLPPAPAGAALPATVASYAAGAPPADPNIATELSQQAQAADRAEQEVLSQAPAQNAGAPAPAGGPATIALGQSIDDVVAILGEPLRIADLGAKKIYSYKDLKVTFTDGRVSDVQ